jgi:hypothetical protein
MSLWAANMGWVVHTHWGRFSFNTRGNVPLGRREDAASAVLAEAVLRASALAHANAGVLQDMARCMAALHGEGSSQGGPRFRRVSHEPAVLAGLVKAIHAGALLALELKVGAPPPSPEPEPEAPWVSHATSTTPLDWIELTLVDEEGQPVPRVEYEVQLPNQSVQRGTLNAEGFARLENIPKGQCTVRFPEFDREAWDQI